MDHASRTYASRTYASGTYTSRDHASGQGRGRGMGGQPWLRWGSWVVVGVTVWLGAGCTGQTPAGTAASLSAQDCEADREFVWVPAGPFVRGSDQAERDAGYRLSAVALAAQGGERSPQQVEAGLRRSRWFEFEANRETVELPGVCFGRNLITNQEYQAFVQATGRSAPGISEADYQTQGFLVHPYATVRAFLWQGNQFPAETAQHPVVLVSHEDAVAFATWKGEQDGNTYRLPTALEWEKAARGETGQYFPWGNDWRDDATNWGDDWEGSEGVQTSAIGAFPLSRGPSGAEDMAGNVFEYTSTLRQRGLETRSVMKGCSWDDSPGFCRAAYAHTRPVQSRHILFGFRLVKLSVADAAE